MSARPRILLTRRWPEGVERHLAQRYDVTLNPADVQLSAAQLTAAMSQYDALCTIFTDAITAEVINAPNRRVQLIGNFGVGFNHIDIAAAQRAGVQVTNTPDVVTDATADLAMLLLLMATRRAGEGERELRAGRWTSWRPTHLLGQGLAGRTLGLIGYGRIGQAVARRARAFGLRVVYSSRRRVSANIEAECGARYIGEIDELLAESDVVSLHCPGSADTVHLLDARRIGMMKPTAVLINTARGTVVDEAALAAALVAKRITAAGLDVYEHEPRVHEGLLALENVVLLPHVGSSTLETRTAMGMRVAENLDAFFDGKPLRDPVV